MRRRTRSTREGIPRPRPILVPREDQFVVFDGLDEDDEEEDEDEEEKEKGG